MSGDSETMPQLKRPRIDSGALQEGLHSQVKWNQQLMRIQSFHTEGETDLAVMQQVLLDIHEARKEVEHMRELQYTCTDDIAQLKRAVAVRAEGAAQKLEKVHSYLIQSFTNSWDIVLHKAQYGEKTFPLDRLPEVPIKKILNYLDLKGRQNVRLVTKRLAQVVIELRPELRVFKTMFVRQKFIRGLVTKGISRLKHFKLHIEYYHAQADMDVLTTWKECLTGLRVLLDKPEISVPYFPNLETLELKDGNEEDVETGQLMTNLISAHSRTLTRLAISNNEGFKIQECKDLPNLKGLEVYCWRPSNLLLQPSSAIKEWSKNILQPMFINWGQRLSVLSLSGNFDLGSMSAADLKLPSLKQLRIDGQKAIAMLNANSEHLEMLSLSMCAWDTNSGLYPSSLPNLKMLVSEYTNDCVPVICTLLKASASSLTHLILSNSTEVNNHSITGPKVTMARLTHLVYDFTSKWTDELIESNADTLEFIAIGMELNYYDFPNIGGEFICLEEIVFLYENADILTAHPYFQLIVDENPDIEMRTEKIGVFSMYANDLIKKYGGDQALHMQVLD